MHFPSPHAYRPLHFHNLNTRALPRELTCSCNQKKLCGPDWTSSAFRAFSSSDCWTILRATASVDSSQPASQQASPGLAAVFCSKPPSHASIGQQSYVRLPGHGCAVSSIPTLTVLLRFPRCTTGVRIIVCRPGKRMRAGSKNIHKRKPRLGLTCKDGADLIYSLCNYWGKDELAQLATSLEP